MGEPRVRHGEFSIVIAGLAVTDGIGSDLGPPATAYVLTLVVLGPSAAPWTEPLARRLDRSAIRAPYVTGRASTPGDGGRLRGRS